MNCSQLLERQKNTNWERPASSLRDLSEDLNRREADSARWSTAKFASMAQTFAPWIGPSLKTSSN